MTMHNPSLAVGVTILALAVACTGHDGPHVGVETGDDNAMVDAVFPSRRRPCSTSPR
ncbi:MAG: hypothetical protein IIA09_18190 [Proteobacteria bacterium]|nr:hypothetical protein [Pseudomonadota bacterium]